MDASAEIPVVGMRVRSMHPQKFALWLFIVSVIMMFMALSSGYLVKKADGNWLLIDMPSMFLMTSVLIVVSSVTMQLAYYAAKHNNLLAIRLWLVVTGLLAVAFLAGQWMSWGQLVEQKAFWVGNVAGSFIYVFTGLHALHLVGGLIFLAVVITNAYRYKVHSKSMVRIEMCATYWHFLGGLWLYLYLFLELNN